MCQASKDIVWATQWIEEVGFNTSLKMPICFCGNNKKGFDLVKNSEDHAKSKHVGIQYHYVREVIQDGLAVTQHILSNKIIADVLTKPLPATTFCKF